jgi:hypothetical protein
MRDHPNQIEPHVGITMDQAMVRNAATSVPKNVVHRFTKWYCPFFEDDVLPKYSSKLALPKSTVICLCSVPRLCINAVTYLKRWTSSNLAKLRSKVATGQCPAFLAISSTRQSEKSTSDRPR